MEAPVILNAVKNLFVVLLKQSSILLRKSYIAKLLKTFSLLDKSLGDSVPSRLLSGSFTLCSG